MMNNKICVLSFYSKEKLRGPVLPFIDALPTGEGNEYVYDWEDERRCCVIKQRILNADECNTDCEHYKSHNESNWGRCVHRKCVLKPTGRIMLFVKTRRKEYKG